MEQIKNFTIKNYKILLALLIGTMVGLSANKTEFITKTETVEKFKTPYACHELARLDNKLIDFYVQFLEEFDGTNETTLYISVQNGLNNLTSNVKSIRDARVASLNDCVN